MIFFGLNYNVVKKKSMCFTFYIFYILLQFIRSSSYKRDQYGKKNGQDNRTSLHINGISYAPALSLATYIKHVLAYK